MLHVRFLKLNGIYNVKEILTQKPNVIESLEGVRFVRALHKNNNIILTVYSFVVLNAKIRMYNNSEKYRLLRLVKLDRTRIK